MRNLLRSMLIGIQFFVANTTELIEPINYEMIREVKYIGMQGYTIRYFNIFDSLCIGYLDSTMYIKDEKGIEITPSKRMVYQTKPLCEIEDKKIATEFTEAYIVNLEFKNNSIHLLISTTPLAPTGEELRECVIDVKDGEFSELVCGESKPAVEIKRKIN